MAVLPTGIGPVTGGYQIERSLRFNSADSAYLNRTPASASNQKTWTWSAWVKRSVLGATKVLFDARGAGSNPVHAFYFNSSDQLAVFIRNASATVIGNYNTSAVFRDLSAWYYITYKFDSTQATATNRVQIYVNGVLQSITASTTISQNADAFINSAISHGIGAEGVTPTDEFDGYMTEVNFVDSPVLLGSTTNASTTITLTTGTTTNIGIGWNVGGTNIPSGATVSSITNSTQFVISSAATATGSSISIGVAPPVSAFGETDSNTGVWKPKAYSGTYGTNGFFLKFADNSNNTAATLGKDSSGNGNNWTPNNFYVGPGTTPAEKAGIDSLVDSPTSYGTDTGVGGEVRGNYCTLNPLTGGATTLSNGNLQTVSPASTLHRYGTIGISSGKFYWEHVVTAGTSDAAIGISNNIQETGSTFTGIRAYLASNGNKYTGTSPSSYGANWTLNDIMGIALDMDNGTLTFYKNNVSQGVAFTGLTGTWFPLHRDGGSVTAILNFGQRAFAYTAPSGFKALCTQNLPTPTIGATSTTQANDYFNTVLYTGNGSTQSITGVGFQPDWVWVKSRSSSGTHSLTDAVRGVNKQLFTNLTDAEGSQTDQVTAFNSDGFSLGANVAGTGSVNVNTVTYAAWNWNAGGSNATNTAGTITSTVRANTTSGFSVVTASASGTSPVTVGHGLGVAPSMVIGRVRNNTANWYVYHSSFSAQDYLVLNSTAAKATSSNIWDVAPTSTVFTIGNPQNGWNGGTAGSYNYVAYCFAPVAGYSAFGSYTGNGSSDGPFVFTNFRPRLVLIKRTDSTGNWDVFDTSRDPYNATGQVLYPNSSSAEQTFSPFGDILSNGFKIRNSAATDFNANGGTYIYMALAENPFKYSLAR